MRLVDTKISLITKEKVFIVEYYFFSWGISSGGPSLVQTANNFQEWCHKLLSSNALMLTVTENVQLTGSVLTQHKGCRCCQPTVTTNKNQGKVV